jgi:DNA-directed RNA polymerase specialized sigma24 family protein
MFQRKKEQVSAAQANAYATSQDFCRIFKDEMDSLYLLALLLTADQEQAERCFAAALDDCKQGRRVFREWASSWSKRAVIKRAIEMVAPASGHLRDKLQAFDRELKSEMNGPMAAIIQLPPLQRFVFVMSALERYSVQDCASLLNCTRQELLIEQSRALQTLADGNRIVIAPGSENFQAGYFLEPAHAA